MAPAEPRDARELRLVVYTATIFTFDGGDTNAYGEPCQPGHGYREDSGFWDPKRYWRVYPTRDLVRADICPARRVDRGAWLAGRIIARLGGIDSHDNGTFTGMREAIHPGRMTDPDSCAAGLVLGTGTFLGDVIASHHLENPQVGLRTIRICAHTEGFTETELGRAVEIVNSAS
jgi:hypothetical protein